MRIQRLLPMGVLLLAPWMALAAPDVVTSLQPVHSLAAGVMQGVGQPRLLVTGGASPHDYSLRPSDARAIAEADIVFWIGPDLESFLVRPLKNAQRKVRNIALLEAPDMTVLPLRTGGAWEAHLHEHGDGHGHKAGHDAHIWLDPVNAIAMVRRMVAVLGEVDSDHKADYERNGAALMERLNQFDQQLALKLAPLKGQSYVVFHDAYQYFERRYGLNAVGSVVLDPEQRPGAKRVAEIQARIRERGVRCVFSEPQFQSALVQTVIAGSQAQPGILDPLGAGIPPGPEAYFQLLEGLVDALRDCLSGS
ncbi:MAG: zinc ABC transporter substrate-binding protein [Candidatus Competibacteraceae bacterium]